MISERLQGLHNMLFNKQGRPTRLAPTPTKGTGSMSLTAEMIEAAIVNESYHVFPGTTQTVCCLTIPGFLSFTGYSDCIRAEDFDVTKGRAAARRRALDSLWEHKSCVAKLTLLDGKTLSIGEEVTAFLIAISKYGPPPGAVVAMTTQMELGLRARRILDKLGAQVC
jgi:hypothetical protein